MIIYLLFHTAAVQFLPDTILGSDIFSGMVDPHQVLTTICWATFLLFASLSFCHHFSFFTRPSRSSFYNMFPFPHLFSSLLSSSPTHLCLLSSLASCRFLCPLIRCLQQEEGDGYIPIMDDLPTFDLPGESAFNDTMELYSQ